jgi:hypothetical protein
MSLSPQAIAEKGEEIYQRKYKAQYEKTHAGKFLAVELGTEEGFLGDTPEEAIRAAQTARDGGYFHLIRIGAPGVYRVGYYADRVAE